MTKEWYLEFRRDQSRDMMELYYRFYLMNGGSLSEVDFFHTFPKWMLFILRGHVVNWIMLQDYVFKTLDKHFSV